MRPDFAGQVLRHFAWLESEYGFAVTKEDERDVASVNQNYSYLNQPTHVFMIKGTAHVSVVPYSPKG